MEKYPTLNKKVHQQNERPNVQSASAGSNGIAVMPPAYDPHFVDSGIELAPGLVLETKLTTNQPGDIYEREADQVAKQIMTMSACQPMSSGLRRIQRLAEPSAGQTAAVPASVHKALAKPGNQLESSLRQDMEQRFGYDFSRVRVHTGTTAEQSAQDVHARAYTVGKDLVFGTGQYAPHTPLGKQILAHELTHVIQQGGGKDGGQPARLQRLDWDDVINAYTWTNPLTIPGKAVQAFTGVELNLLYAAEQAARRSATRIVLPPKHIRKLQEYANASPNDGAILYDALKQSPSYYKGSFLLDANSSAEAMTFGNSIFFSQSPPDVATYIHEMVHIHQYNKLGRGAFLSSYFGLSLATIVSRVIRGQPINVMSSSPHEDAAYNVEDRFKVWFAKNPN